VGKIRKGVENTLQVTIFTNIFWYSGGPSGAKTTVEARARPRAALPRANTISARLISPA
jgi:hypothetical protein